MSQATFAFTAALQDFMRIGRMVVWLIVGLVLFAVALLYLATNSNAPRMESYSALSSLLVFQILPLASAIFTSAVVSAEVEQKTIVYLLTRPIPRWQLLLARSLASVVAVIFVGLIALIAVSLAVFGTVGHPQFGKDLIAMVIGGFAYGSFFLLLSLVINRSMIVALLFAFGWEMALPRLPGDVRLLSINTYVTGVSQRPSVGGADGLVGGLASAAQTSVISPTFSWIVLLSITTFCLGMSMAWFTRSEIVPREDVE